jgi:hypothetical protein
MSPEEWLASQQAAPAAPAPMATAPAAAPAAAPMSPEQWAASQPKMGFFEGIAESVTGRARATPETQTLPEWTSMPELNQMSVASFKTALGTLLRHSPRCRSHCSLYAGWPSRNYSWCHHWRWCYPSGH